MKNFFTSESVTSGHPDKICDIISDSVLDEFLRLDPSSRVACECSVTTDFLLIMGEITSTAKVDVKKIARNAIKEIGYTDKKIGFSADKVKILLKLNTQSPDIAMGVDNSTESSSGDKYDKIGAGDQGIMFGYACTETKELMPLPITLSHNLCKKLEEVRKSGELTYLRPDGKGQVTVEYKEGKPFRIEAVVLSSQHDDTISTEQLRIDLKEKVIDKILAMGGCAIVTADHGNADKMSENGSPFTAHTTNKVPFIVVGEEFKNRQLADGGVLADIAPTLLDMMGIEKPVEMSGKSLLK